MSLIVIVPTPPPNYQQIIRAFPWVKTRSTVVFAYGRTIHVPFGDKQALTPDLIEHEATHCRQQGDDPAGWWSLYVEDNDFRLSQEIEAYAAQYRFLKEHYDRATCRTMLSRIAITLASPLYGNLITKAEAKAAIREAA